MCGVGSVDIGASVHQVSQLSTRLYPGPGCAVCWCVGVCVF